MTNSGCDWTRVRLAYPLSEIEVGEGLRLRPLREEDLGRLCDFMTGDPDMTWPRVSWSRENVSYLLGLRLKHYAEFGFGPYGVDMGNTLIGMAGVQTWDYEPCSVELLTYIRKENWAGGLGTRLLRWVVDQAREYKIGDYIYAATRQENERANNLARRLGFEETGHGVHFGYPSIKWRMSLLDPTS